MIGPSDRGWTRFFVFVVLAGALLGAGCLRACQWLDHRVDVQLRWEEVSSP